MLSVLEESFEEGMTLRRTAELAKKALVGPMGGGGEVEVAVLRRAEARGQVKTRVWERVQVQELERAVVEEEEGEPGEEEAHTTG